MNKGGRPTLPADQKLSKPIAVGLKPYQQDMLKAIKQKIRDAHAANNVECNIVDADVLRMCLEEHFKKLNDS
jgi:hypothetical protein